MIPPAILTLHIVLYFLSHTPIYAPSISFYTKYRNKTKPPLYTLCRRANATLSVFDSMTNAWFCTIFESLLFFFFLGYINVMWLLQTDKASLLAEVIQHVKELKRQTSLIAETSPVPTEIDELTVDNEPDQDGKPVIKASICCEDRSDLLPDLIKTLKALRLRTVKAEITTLGGRVKNVLFITGEEESNSCDGEGEQQQHSISSIQEALKAVMEKTNEESGSGSVKRQRTNINILEHRSLWRLLYISFPALFRFLFWFFGLCF